MSTDQHAELAFHRRVHRSLDLITTFFSQPTFGRGQEGLDDRLVVNRFEEAKATNSILIVGLLHLVDDCRHSANRFSVDIGHKHFSLCMLVERVLVDVQLQASHRVQRKDNGGIVFVERSAQRKEVVAMAPS